MRPIPRVALVRDDLRYSHAGRWSTSASSASGARDQRTNLIPVPHSATLGYAGAGDTMRFVRVGTLHEPDLLPPDLHIFTMSKQPWLVLPPGTPAVPEYYAREAYWPKASLERRAACWPRTRRLHDRRSCLLGSQLARSSFLVASRLAHGPMIRSLPCSIQDETHSG